MSRIRVDQLVNQNSSGPTLAVEGLKIPSTKNLEVDGSIVLGGNPGLNGQVISRTTSGLQWASVPLTDNNTTYTVNAIDSSTNAVTEKVIRLTANGGTNSEVVLVAGTNVNLTRDGDRITLNSSYTDTNTVTKIGANGANYTDGDVSIVGTGSAIITQSGRTITVNATDTNTTYTGINGVTIDSSNRIQIGQPVGASDAVQFASLTITGNLIVQGTTVTNNQETITSASKFITLNDVLLPSDSAATGGGIILKGDTDHSILWSNTFDRWDTTENWNLVANKEYQIGGSAVVTSTGLGPNIVSSNLTSVGTLSTGTWNGTTIGIAYGGTGATTANSALNALLPQQAANSGKYLITDGTNSSWSAIPGTYSGWTLSDTFTSTTIPSGTSVTFVGSGSTSVLLDNVNKKITVDSTNTQYTYAAVDGSINTEKVIRLTDSANNLQDITLVAGTGVTISRSSNKLTLSVAQDLSSSANPTFASLNVTGTLTAGTYEGSASSMTGLTGATSGSYGSSNLIPVITVDATGKVTSISTAPNTGASAETPTAGGQSNYIQYNNSGGLAGNSKFQFEPSSGKVELDGTLDANTLSSASIVAEDVVVSNYLKLPNKTPSERDNLVVQNGTIVYNSSTKTVEIYEDSSWKNVGPVDLSISKLSTLQDVSSSTPEPGQVLKWSGSEWAPGTDLSGAGSSGIQLADLSSLTLNANATSSLVYDNTTGVFAYTPPDLSAYLTSYTESDPIFGASAASGITSGNISDWNAAHQWGNHSSQGYLTTISANNLSDLANVSNQAPSDGQVLKWSQAQGKWAPGTDNVGSSSSGIQLGDLSVSTETTPSSGGALTYDDTNGTFAFTPAAVFSGSWNDLADTPSLFDGTWASLSGKPSLATVATSGDYGDLSNRPTLVTTLNQLTDVDTTGAVDTKILKYNGTNWVVADDTGGINDVVDDTTPQLGGNLDLSGNNITGTGAIDVVGDVKGTSITSGAVTFTGLDGNPGQVLTTNGSGAATWTTVSSGSTTGTLNDVTTNGSTTANTITVGGLDLAASNHKIRIGASNTFQIYNDGTSDRILTSGADLKISTTNTDLLLESTGGTVKINDLARISTTGVELWNDGYSLSKKFETTDTGVKVTGLLNVTGTNAGKTIQINGVDLDITHLANVSSTAPSPGQVLKWDGTNNEWAPGTDNVGSASSGIALTDLSVSTGSATGGGELTYDDSNGTFTFKPAVVTETDTLASVTSRANGNTTTNSITVGGLTSTNHITAGNSKEIRLGDTATGDFVIVHNGSANVLGSPEGDNLLIKGASGATRATFNEAGSVELYHSGTKKVETTATGITVSGHVSVTGGSSSQWNTAYGWGDHSTENYLTSYTETDTLDSVTSRTGGATTTNAITVAGNGTTGGISLSDGLLAIRTGTGNVASIDLYCEVNNAHKVSVKAPAHSNFSGNVNFTLPGSNGTNGWFLKTDGSGNTSWAAQATQSTPNLNAVLTAGNTSTTAATFGKLTVAAGSSVSELELSTDNNNQYKATIKAPAASLLSGNTTFVLPPNNGTVNQVLISDGSGNTSWSTLSGGGGGGSSVTINDAAPGTPGNGDLWWNSNTGQLKIWYDDGSGSPSAQWVDAAGGGGGGAGGVTLYTGVANYPSASTMEGQLAYASDINALHVSDGSSWTNNRVVTTTNASSSDFDTLLGSYEKTYTLSVNAHTAGTTAENNARKIIKLVDNSANDAGKFTINAGSGLTTALTTDTWSNSSLDLGLHLQDVHNYTLTTTANAGPAASNLKIQDSVRSISNEITFAGANGITIERTDANTLTFRQGGTTITQYTDAMAKDAAWNAISGGTHSGITWTYDSTNKYINATATGGGGGGGGYTYTLTGRNTTAANAFIDLTDNATPTPNVNSIEFIGSNGTDVDWDSTNKKITINSKDYSVGAPAAASGSGSLALVDSTFTYTPPNLSGYLTTVPQASASVVGGIKVGTGLTMDAATGVLSANAGGYTLPTAGVTAAGDLGGVKVDGTTITIDANSVISSSGGSTVPSIGDVNATSTSIADNARGDLTIVGHKGYVLYKIHSSHEAWIRLYVDDATRQLDANRSEGNDPQPGSGVIAEVRTSAANEAVLITPGVMGFNNDSPERTQNIYVSINNRSGSAATIQVTLTVLKIGE